eukprot:CAMPEP_0115874638 /NCGR_PEP_ID=MMETSP0287-20121206/24651_1 /TAXON_ID=412157 /ORGANISM="Chrysochromulina rotalis, Strain UIO044" /LENGTH=35 /DNA_ID= /DNA_START= /DNA_END= /DNA_ORIENTATION=
MKRFALDTCTESTCDASVVNAPAPRLGAGWPGVVK